MHHLTIIMYHYVRDLKNSQYPNIKALKTSQFKDQIKYLKENYTIVSAEDCIRVVENSDFQLPPMPALLTFDDGYVDHFKTVFPILKHHQLPGSFFVPAKTVQNNEVLDVNKIHFMLASVEHPEPLVEEINRLLLMYQHKYSLHKPEYYYKKLADKDRYDSKAVVFIKRLLQKELDAALRKKIIDRLFQKYVTHDEKAFSQKLYMNKNQIRHMINNDMYVGGHGYDHLWLDGLTAAHQQNEIDGTIRFLNHLGVSTQKWIMCYPYGAYNNRLIKLLKRRNCKLGLTTKVDYAHLTPENAFTLERFDTNDLQKLTKGIPNAISASTVES